MKESAAVPNNILFGFKHLFFPDLCPACRAPILIKEAPICAMCTFYLERVDEEDIRTSMRKLPEAQNAFGHIFALWQFDKAGTVQKIHQNLKYKNRPYHGIWLGKLMGRTFILPLHPLDKPDIIIPIPLHKRRLLERGYNQSDLLAQGLSEVSGIPFSTEALTRRGYTQTQTGLDRTERLTNVSHAFTTINEHKVQDKHVMLVDDVLTTGATLYAASIPIREAGASTVSAITLAMARM